MILLTVCNTFYYVWNRVFYYMYLLHYRIKILGNK